jgi:SAM-dependent methyltransferase
VVTDPARTDLPPFAAVVCPACRAPLAPVRGGRACRACGGSYDLRDGILEIESGEGVDLRIGDDLLDIHALRRHGLYFGAPLSSAVERAARVHSAAFVDLHAELLGPFLRDALVADLGCGQLPYLAAFAGRGVRDYYAFDLSRESLRVARTYAAPHFPLHPVRCGVKGVPLADGAADVAISSEVLEHVEDPAAYLRELRRVVRPGGHLSLSTPCASLSLAPSVLLPLLARPHRIPRWWRSLNPHTCWEEALAWHPALRPSVLRRWIREAGFRVVRHETRLWFYGSRFRPAWRTFSLLEAAGWRGAGAAFARYLEGTDRILASGLPLIRWGGIRQFVLAERMP